MLNRPLPQSVILNPLLKSPFYQGDGNANFAPPSLQFMITETTNTNIISESGDFMITET